MENLDCQDRPFSNNPSNSIELRSMGCHDLAVAMQTNSVEDHRSLFRHVVYSWLQLLRQVTLRCEIDFASKLRTASDIAHSRILNEAAIKKRVLDSAPAREAVVCLVCFANRRKFAQSAGASEVVRMIKQRSENDSLATECYEAFAAIYAKLPPQESALLDAVPRSSAWFEVALSSAHDPNEVQQCYADLCNKILCELESLANE